MSKKIILLAGHGISTNILYHALKNEFEISAVILESSEDKKVFLQRRIKKLGIWRVFGQVLFQALIVPLLQITSAKRKSEIVRLNHLDINNIPEGKITHVGSVNDDTCLQVLKNINPDIVIVNGTRIISKSILQAIPAIFINTHAGITPKYRGVHGGYWALVNKDPANCGVTIHLVDKGIDTGGIIYQQPIGVTPKDSFVTYPLLQIAAGIPFMKVAIQDILQQQVIVKQGSGKSLLWSHPTITQYFYHRLVHHIK